MTTWSSAAICTVTLDFVRKRHGYRPCLKRTTGLEPATFGLGSRHLRGFCGISAHPLCLSDSEFASELRSPGHVSEHGLPPRFRGSRDDGYEERRSPGASEIRATETAGSRRLPLPISLALDQAHATPVWCTLRCLKTGALFGSWCQSTIGPERECFSRIAIARSVGFRGPRRGVPLKLCKELLLSDCLTPRRKAWYRVKGLVAVRVLGSAR